MVPVMRAWKLLTLAIVLAGCSTTIDAVERTKKSEFLPSGDRTSFTFVAEAVATGETNENAEAPLRHWLEEWLQEKRMCTSGYTITTVDRMKTFSASEEGTYRVIMQGRCNS